jgi:ubiquinone/menaquinone biosynthesis C-methylase UbiE
MNHDDHVNLLRKGVPERGGVWADLGSGAGAFTLALAELIGAGGEIYAVDRDRRALKELESAMRTRFPQVKLYTRTADFTQKLDLPPVDGIVMANSLHFVRDKLPVLKLVQSYLRSGGRLVMVEYNTDQGNTWVPYPFSFSTWEALAIKVGFVETQLLSRRPSRFLGEIYSAVSLKPG